MRHGDALAEAVALLRRLLGAVHIDRLHLDALAGLGDPAEKGQLYDQFCPVIYAPGGYVAVVPNFIHDVAAVTPHLAAAMRALGEVMGLRAGLASDDLEALNRHQIVELMLAMRSAQGPLTTQTLHYWHKLLFHGIELEDLGRWRSFEIEIVCSAAAGQLFLCPRARPGGIELECEKPSQNHRGCLCNRDT